MSLPPGFATALDQAVQTPVVRALSGAARELAGLLMPTLCVICGRQDGTVCPDCAPGLVAELLRPFRAERDAAALPLLHTQPVPASLLPTSVQQGPAPVPRPVPVVAAARYGSDASRALLAFKDHGRTSAARYLRPAVHRALAAAPELLEVRGPFTLVPVPGSAAGFRRRGYDPVDELLAGPLPSGWELARGWLAHRHQAPRAVLRNRASHTGTGSRQRRNGSLDRFRTTPRLLRGYPRHRGRSVVVFDDVMTTGSTLAATWRALEQAGLHPVGAVVLAAVTAPGTAAGTTPGGGLNST